MVILKYDEIPFGKSTRNLEPDPEGFDFDGLKVSHIKLQIDLTKNERSTTVAFSVEAKAALVCDRSLEYFDKVLYGDYQVIFKIGVDPNEDVDEAWKQLDTSSNKIDITKEVRDTILLSVPIKKLHPRYYDEKGEEKPFEQSFPDEPDIDPRWEKLKELKRNLNQN